MAKIEFSGIDAMQMALNNAADGLNDLTDTILEQGGSMIKTEVEQSIYRYGHIRTGELLRSIKIKKKKTKGGANYIYVTPTGTDTGGVRNATKGFVLNYGRSNMPGTRYWDAANAKAEERITPMAENELTNYLREKGLN